MSANRFKAVLVSAALVGGAMLMTACQESDSGSNTAQGSATAPPAAQPVVPPPAPSTTGGNQGGGNGTGGKDSGGKESGAKNSPAPQKDSGAKSSGGQSTTTGGAGSGDSGSIGKCRTADLQMRAEDATIGGDADNAVLVTLRNIGHNCTMSGFPGVDLLTNAGPLSAKRVGAPAEAFTLKTDTSVSFGIYYPSNNTGGSGVRITGLQVTPPGETETVPLQWPGAASLPVTDGAGSPVKVTPIGGAGQGGTDD